MTTTRRMCFGMCQYSSDFSSAAAHVCSQLFHYGYEDGMYECISYLFGFAVSMWPKKYFQMQCSIRLRWKLGHDVICVLFSCDVESWKRCRGYITSTCTYECIKVRIWTNVR